jgi:hypothetical protein
LRYRLIRFVLIVFVFVGLFVVFAPVGLGTGTAVLGRLTGGFLRCKERSISLFIDVPDGVDVGTMGTGGEL